MSGEDDTFDIDLYGDDAPEEQQEEQDIEIPQDEGASAGGLGNDGTTDKSEHPQNGAVGSHSTQSGQTPASQGTKRKAPDDESEEQANTTEQEQVYDDRPVDPGALPALKLSELQWWTTEEDLRAICVQAGAEDELHEIAFGEHKINGKSRGEAYLEFANPQAATAVRRLIEQTHADVAGKEGGSSAGRHRFQAWFTPVGNPFRNKDSAAGGKKDFGGGGPGKTQGAYNSYGNTRGSFGGGRGGYNNRGGGGGHHNGMMGRGGGGQWGMNNVAPANNTGYSNQMMGGFNPMGFGGMMGNMGGGMGMHRGGGMMGNMMGRGGGFGGGMPGMGMNMMGGGMNMMGGGRGGGMMGRGGWAGGGGGGAGGGFQGGMQQVFNGMGQQQDPTQMNKKPRMQ